MLGDALELIVPPASLEVDATHKGTIAGKSDRQAALPRRPLVVCLLLVVRRILLVYEVKCELEGVNFDTVAASIVLQDGSQEAVGEEKAWEPEDLGWLLIVNPFLQRLDT